MTLKTRSFPDKNYRAVYFNGKTIRFVIDPSRPIEDLDWPEFYDIKLTNRCDGGCSYCYQDSACDNEDYEAVDQLDRFLGSMTENQKPFQIAYGGGEPTMHPQFHIIMALTRGHGIAPNYTTNGMFAVTDGRDDIIATTKKHCEGVAISCHDHLEDYWVPCANLMLTEGVFLNFHNIIGDRNSTDRFMDIYSEWTGRIKYFVVLPMINHGRASGKETDFDYFFDSISEIDDISDIAFGANFHPELEKRPEINVDVYEPEIMSKYLDLKDMALYPSSFSTDRPIRIAA